MRDWGALPEGVRPPPMMRKLPTGDYRQRFLSQEEIGRLLAACDRIDHPYLSLFIRFLLLTGGAQGRGADIEVARHGVRDGALAACR